MGLSCHSLASGFALICGPLPLPSPGASGLPQGQAWMGTPPVTLAREVPWCLAALPPGLALIPTSGPSLCSPLASGSLGGHLWLSEMLLKCVSSPPPSPRGSGVRAGGFSWSSLAVPCPVVGGDGVWGFAGRCQVWGAAQGVEDGEGGAGKWLCLSERCLSWHGRGHRSPPCPCPNPRQIRAEALMEEGGVELVPELFHMKRLRGWGNMRQVSVHCPPFCQPVQGLP